ncbi:homogentisate 1,2-dioxygenase-like protein [Ochromonadaceae sp. CCMP2298]|nr:homogentisate 1,2-dioxygenase-like protein [Ochromonadaceae sp. CCMP2298]
MEYQSGFGNHFSTEALPGALPLNQNSPQLCSYGLFAEQLSGTAFTAPRGKNLRSWLYRIHPSVVQSRFEPMASQPILDQFASLQVDPNQMRWSPMEVPSGDSVDFVQGLKLMCGAGDPGMKEGVSIYHYALNASMQQKAFLNSDGDFLIVPEMGALCIKTEMGSMMVAPQEIAVVPRGVKFSVGLREGTGEDGCRGYVTEIFQGHFELPGLGPIGANGLANPRDFQAPVACFEDVEEEHLLVNKFQNSLFQATLPHSPFDVVAWHGNYCPYKYDLRSFNCMNSVSFDHPDPSIYTVLTCPSNEPGVAVLDFVIFPPRWMVAEKTFRPPYFHRNCMSEYMGLIYGKYDAKAASAGGGGFVAGGASLHSCMTPHGPDSATFAKASSAPALPPVYFDQGLAFMFETCYMLKVAPAAKGDSADTSAGYPPLQSDYAQCWQSMPKLFNGSAAPPLPWA